MNGKSKRSFIFVLGGVFAVVLFFIAAFILGSFSTFADSTSAFETTNVLGMLVAIIIAGGFLGLFISAYTSKSAKSSKPIKSRLALAIAVGVGGLIILQILGSVYHDRTIKEAQKQSAQVVY